MPQTFTATAYSASPKEIVSGVNSAVIDYRSGATSLSASAGATVILGPKIPNGSTILQIFGSHSSGAGSCPVDIGFNDELSAFASQKTQGSNAICDKVSSVPYKVSVSDDAANLYRVIALAPDPGTDTRSVEFKYTVLFSRDP